MQNKLYNGIGCNCIVNYSRKGEEYMRLSTRTIVLCRKFALLCYFISIPFTIIGMGLRALSLSIIGFVLISVAVLTSLLFWRCPHCKRLLPTRFNAKDANNDIDGFYVCPYCNTRF